MMQQTQSHITVYLGVRPAWAAGCTVPATALVARSGRRSDSYQIRAGTTHK